MAFKNSTLLYLWIDVVFSRQELLGTEPLCSLMLEWVEVVHLTGIKCMYIFVSSQAFTWNMLWSVSRRMYRDCMSINRRKVSEFRTIESDKHHRSSCSLEVLEIMGRCLLPWTFNDAGQFEYSIRFGSWKVRRLNLAHRSCPVAKLGRSRRFPVTDETFSYSKNGSRKVLIR